MPKNLRYNDYGTYQYKTANGTISTLSGLYLNHMFFTSANEKRTKWWTPSGWTIALPENCSMVDKPDCIVVDEYRYRNSGSSTKWDGYWRPLVTTNHIHDQWYPQYDSNYGIMWQFYIELEDGEELNQFDIHFWRVNNNTYNNRTQTYTFRVFTDGFDFDKTASSQDGKTYHIGKGSVTLTASQKGGIYSATITLSKPIKDNGMYWISVGSGSSQSYIYTYGRVYNDDYTGLTVYLNNFQSTYSHKDTVYIKVGGAYKKGTMYVKTGGTYKEGHPYVKENNEYIP